jgi:putative DNA primase/helicase
MIAPHEAVAEVIGAMEAAGIRPTEPIAQRLASGSLIRFRCEGDSPARANGWAVLHLDGVPAGAFGNYRLSISRKWRSGVAASISPTQRAAMRRASREAQARRDAQKQAAWQSTAATASNWWAGAGRVQPDHRYIDRKDMTGEGLRQRGNLVLIPMRDIDGTLWNLQRIAPDGTKLFLKGGRTDGLMWLCGQPDAVICIGEGVSTMAAVRRATGHAVVASLSEKNLLPVARAVAGQWPDLDFIICADDDAHLVDHPTIARNLGIDAARAAALAIGGRLALPPRGE